MLRTTPQPMTKSLNFVASTDKVDCGTDFIGTGDVTVCVWVNPNTKVTANGRIVANGKYILMAVGGVIALVSDGATSASGSTILEPNKWHFVSVTRTSAGVTNFRISGALNGSANQSSGTPAVATTNTFIGNDSGAATKFPGKLKNIQVFNRILTTTEQDNIMLSGTQPTDYATSIKRHFTFENDTSTTCYSQNDITKTGTITGATFSSDTPLVARTVLGQNLVQNGNFEQYSYASPQVATTTGSRWVDGTAAGSTSNNYGWRASISGTGSSIYDTTIKYSGSASLKVSTLATASYVEARSNGSVTYNEKNGFIVKPSTSYTVTYKMKTNYVSGDSSDGAHLAFVFSKIDGSAGSTIVGTKVKTTTGWTDYSQTFTTAASDYWCHAELRLYGHTGAATLIMDAWFDDIVLKETVTPTRSLPTYRLMPRNMGTSLYMNSANTVNFASPVVDFYNNLQGAYSFCFKVNAIPNAGNFGIFGSGASRLDVNIENNTGLIFVWFTDSTNTGYNLYKDTDRVVGIWRHIIISKDAGYIDVYIDGVRKSHFATTNKAFSAGSAYFQSGNNGIIIIDDLKAWNRGLTQSEAQQVYYDNVIAKTGLTGQWLMDEGSGTTLLDTGPGIATTDQSQLTGGSDIIPGTDGTNDFDYAQSFVPTATSLSNVIVYKDVNVGSPIGNLVFSIVNNNAGQPGSTVYATATISNFLWNSYAVGEVSIPLATTLTPATTYWLKIENDAVGIKGSGYQVYQLRRSSGATAGNLRLSTNGGTYNSIGAVDLYFKTQYLAYNNGTITGATYRNDTALVARTLPV